MLKNAKWIWNSKNFGDDEYVDFVVDFSIIENKNVKLDISFDGAFAAFVNGKLACFGECSDDEENKLCDSFLLDEYISSGKNTLLITVWHHGANCATYKYAKAGCIFAVSQGDKLLCASSEDTLSRINPNYKSGYLKFITGQLGLSYKYDKTKEDTPFTKSQIIDKSKNLTPRNIENLILGDRISTQIKIENNLVTVDMLKETVGFLELDFISEQSQELLICYGEHLDKNGRVARIIEGRDFSVEYTAKKGENKFIAPLRRLAGRYIQFEISSPVKINYAALRPVNYPVKVVDRNFNNPLHKQIYDTSVYTLKCCMHAHYEDCPWREQALYALDSRNQMLSGYYAFNEYRFARHSLVLLSRSYIKELQLLNLTYPKMTELPIPFFSLAYPLQVYEYVVHSGDKSILDEVGDVLDGIMQGFEKRIDDNGLIPTFPYPCWNFYEWTDGNHNELEIGRKASDPYKLRYDLILNAMYVYASSFYNKLTGNKKDLSKTVRAIKETFFDKERGLYKNNSWGEGYSVVANAFAILCGAADKTLAQKIVDEREKLVDISLSMNGFLYEALLSADESFKDYIIKDIEQKYGYMLSCGATTFWETILGAEDFNGAGSLCHGWSAIPVYWLTKLVD